MTRPTYPMAVVDGRLALTTLYPAKVAQAIAQAVLTETEERVMRPTYGRDVQPFDTGRLPRVLAGLRQAIEKGLEGHKGVTFALYGSWEDDGVLGVTVAYECPDFPAAEVYLRLPGS